MIDAVDFRSLDYDQVFLDRYTRLKRLQAIMKEDETYLPKIKAYYKDDIATFIEHWGITYDPRAIEIGKPSRIPFILFPRQREWINWVIARWKNQEGGASEKSRDMGLSWLSVSVACSLCLFYPGMAIGFGSRKEEYVDRVGFPKSLFFKARMFMENVPKEFRGEWSVKRDAPHMRLSFPDQGSNISGEAGNNIGRGDRAAIYFVDEAAYLEQPEDIDAALSQTTNCRIDISSAHGMANPFAQKVMSLRGSDRLFTFHWRDDPRKDEDWYAKQKRDFSRTIVAQEIDIDYSASVEGLVIQSEWVQAAIDAHKKLGFEVTGEKRAALDLADEGPDKNVFVGIHGVLIENVYEWSGKTIDIAETMDRAFDFCDEHDYDGFLYDADGLGAGARGDARKINDKRKISNLDLLEVVPFRGSGAVIDPHKQAFEEGSTQGSPSGRKSRTNADYFGNFKAQAWWSLRTRFIKTWRSIEGIEQYPYDELISIDSALPLRNRIIMELAQPTFIRNQAGKMLIDKKPDGAASPNLADSIMMVFSPTPRRMVISPDTVRRVQMMGRMAR